jgi:DNA-directed RNA polymerase delta subunit
MHFRDIALHIDESGLRSKRTHSHPQTVHNELIKDKRFVLVGRGTYALTDWGYKAGTVKEVITDVLREAGKPLAKQEVVDAVLKMRQVKVTTIAINLNSFFVKDAEGRFSLKK